MTETTRKGSEEKGRRLSYRFRLYPTPEQERYFNVNFGCTRFVYNHFLSERIRAYEATRQELRDGTPNPSYDPNAKPMSFYDTSRALTTLKRETVDEEGRRWLYDADATALVYSLRHLDAAYQNFFRRVKKGEKPGFPKFKSRYSDQSFTIAECKVIDGRHVRLPKIGSVRAKVHREVDGEIVAATISRNAAGQYHISINVKGAEQARLPESEGKVGIAMGVNPWIVTSDGEVFGSRRDATRRLERKLLREQRRLSRKKVGSNNFKKQKRKLARTYLRIANARSYGIHAITRRLVNENGTIFSREMSSKEMLQADLSKKYKIRSRISDASFFEINRQLAYKSEWAGRTFVLVPHDVPTAQVCAACGHKHVELAQDLKREWQCPECGETHDRKYNGATNVLEAGIDILTGEEQAYVTKEAKRTRETRSEKAARKAGEKHGA